LITVKRKIRTSYSEEVARRIAQKEANRVGAPVNIDFSKGDGVWFLTSINPT
jgi:hypothetical protein